MSGMQCCSAEFGIVQKTNVSFIFADWAVPTRSPSTIPLAVCYYLGGKKHYAYTMNIEYY